MRLFKRKKQESVKQDFRQVMAKRVHDADMAFRDSDKWKTLEGLSGTCQFGNWKVITADPKMYIWIEKFNFLIHIGGVLNPYEDKRIRVNVSYKNTSIKSSIDLALLSPVRSIEWLISNEIERLIILLLKRGQ